MSKRKNVTISDELAKWYEERAKEMGTTQSALMAMALDYYVREEKMINLMSNMQAIAEKLQIEENKDSDPSK